jgi:hypothetical protein
MNAYIKVVLQVLDMHDRPNIIVGMQEADFMIIIIFKNIFFRIQTPNVLIFEKKALTLKINEEMFSIRRKKILTAEAYHLIKKTGSGGNMRRWKRTIYPIV